MRYIKITGIIIGTLLVAFIAAQNYWRHLMENNTNMDQAYRQRGCVTESPDKKIAEFESMGHGLKVAYVEAAAEDCITPHFPIVIFETTGSKQPDAWIHIVHSKNIPYFHGKPFIDSAPNRKTLYPFYSRQKTMTDAPAMGYHLIRTKTLDWVGHAYAVTLDKDDNITGVLGGIRWGYLIKPWALRPEAITPSPLSQEQWQKDFKTFNTLLQKVKQANQS